MASPDEEQMDLFTDALESMKKQIDTLEKTFVFVLRELEEQGYGSFADDEEEGD